MGSVSHRRTDGCVCVCVFTDFLQTVCAARERTFLLSEHETSLEKSAAPSRSHSTRESLAAGLSSASHPPGRRKDVTPHTSIPQIRKMRAVSLFSAFVTVSEISFLTVINLKITVTKQQEHQQIQIFIYLFFLKFFLG